MFVQTNGHGNDTYYIFIIPGPTKDASKKAFMPRKRQSGFVYTANLPNSSTTEYWATVIAHELGHGAFRLEHHAGASSTTDNLMDYRMGRFLHQYQWNFVHNPVPMIALFQDDEDGAYFSYSYFASGLAKSYSIQDFKGDDEVYTFVAPSGHPISLRSDAKNLQFESKLTCFGGCPSHQFEINIAKGTLSYFEVGSKSYYAKVSNGIFVGYADMTTENANFYEDSISEAKNTGFINIVPDDVKEYFNCDIVPGEHTGKYYAKGDAVSSISNSCIRGTEYNEAITLFADELQKLINDPDKFAIVKYQGGIELADGNSRFKAFEIETGRRIFVVQQPVDLELRPTDRDGFINDIIEKVRGFRADKDILICVPYKSTNNFSPPFTKWFIRGLNEQPLINSQLTTDFVAQLKNIYKQIPKPYYEIGYYITFGGDIYQLTGIQRNQVSGYEHIYDFKLVIDQRFDGYAKAFNDVYKSRPDPNNPSHKNEYYIQAYYNKVQNLETYTDRHAETGDALLNHGLKEHYLKPNSNGKSEVAQQFVNAFVQYELKEFYKGDIARFPGNDKFISGRAPDYIDPHDIVFDFLDVTSFILSFLDADIIPEALGAVYAGVVGRHDEMETRLIGTAVALGTAAVVLRQFNKIKAGRARYTAADKIVDVAKGAGSWLDNLPAGLRADIGDINSDLGKFFANATEAKRVQLVDSWKVLSDAGVNKALRSDPDKLTKVNRYLDNNPTRKQAFIDDLKKTSDPGKFVDRTSWKDDLIKKYGDDINQFQTKGLSKADIPQSVYDDMLKASNAPASFKETAIGDAIKAGSEIPVKEAFKAGDELYKIVPKGQNVSDFSPFWITKNELDNVRKLGHIEQKLGLPLNSHSVQYDLLKITATNSGDIFKSKIAPTFQNSYETVGGATQTLVLNRTLWSSPIKVETFIP